MKKGLNAIHMYLASPLVMSCQIYCNKKQCENRKSGKIQIEEGDISLIDIHLEAVYFWIMLYTIIERFLLGI